MRNKLAALTACMMTSLCGCADPERESGFASIGATTSTDAATDATGAPTTDGPGASDPTTGEPTTAEPTTGATDGASATTTTEPGPTGGTGTSDEPGDTGDTDDTTGNPNPDIVCVDLQALPEWRQGLAVGEWKLLQSAKISEVTPEVQPGGGYYGRIDAWNGLATDTTTSRVYLGGAGGHHDYAGNEVYMLDLTLAAPQWELQMQPSPASQYAENSPYYLDGRPTPTHTYYTAWFIEQRGKFFRFAGAAAWGDGNGGTPHIDSWDPVTKEWDPAGTNPDMGPAPIPEMPTAKHVVTGEVYQVQSNNHLYHWDPQTNSASDLGDIMAGDGSFYDLSGSASVVDIVGERLLILHDAANPGSARVYDIKAATFSSAPLSGPGAEAVATEQGMAWFDVCAGTIVVKTRSGGEVIGLDPTTLEAAPFAVSGATPPDPQNGVHGLFQYVPALGGYAYQPIHDSPLYFLATQ